MDLALNNLQWLICHKTKPNQYEYVAVHFLCKKKKNHFILYSKHIFKI